MRHKKAFGRTVFSKLGVEVKGKNLALKRNVQVKLFLLKSSIAKELIINKDKQLFWFLPSWSKLKYLTLLLTLATSASENFMVMLQFIETVLT